MENTTTLLVAEDFEATRTLLRKIFERTSFRVIFAAGVQETLRAARNERPDVILMDVNLIDGNGMNAARELKDDPATSRIPIIAMSSISPEELRVVAGEAGCSDYMSKPFTIYDLTWRVARCLLRTEPVESLTG